MINSINSELENTSDAVQASIDALKVDTYPPYQNGVYHTEKIAEPNTLLGDGIALTEFIGNDSAFIKQSIPNRISLEGITYTYKELLSTSTLLREGIIDDRYSGSIESPTYITLSKDGMLVDNNGNPTIITLYGLDYYGNHISEEVGFYIPGIQRLTKSFYYMAGYTTSTSLDITGVTISIANNYSALDTEINDYSYQEVMPDKTIQHISWSYRAESGDDVLIKTVYSSHDINAFYRGDIQMFETVEYILTNGTTSIGNINSLLVDDRNKLLYINGDDELYIYHKENELTDLVQYINTSSSFCPLEVDIHYNVSTKNIEFKGLFKVDARANRIYKYRFRVVTLSEDRYMTTNNITTVNTASALFTDTNVWHHYNDSASYGFKSPEYSYTLDSEDIAIILDVMDVSGAISSTVEYVPSLYKNPIKSLGAISGTLSFDNNNRIILKDNTTYSYINYHYDNYFKDNNYLYWLDDYTTLTLNGVNIKDTHVTDKIYSEIDDIAALLNLERKYNESIDNFIPYVKQLKNTNIGSNEKNLIYGISTELRSLIEPALIKGVEISVDNIYDKQIVISEKSIFVDDNQTELIDYGIEDLIGIMEGNSKFISNETQSAEHLLPYKNYRTIQLNIRKDIDIYPIIYKHEKIYTAYALNSNVDPDDNEIEIYPTYIKYTGDLEYISVIIVIIEKYYMLHYSNIAAWGLKQYLDSHLLGSGNSVARETLINNIYNKTEEHAPTRLI